MNEKILKDLAKIGITGVKKLHYNPSYEELFKFEMDPSLEGFDKGQLTELDAVNVMTGIYTGRSPKDKFIVMDENSKDTVWWTTDEYKNDNHVCSQETWNVVKDLAKKQLCDKELFVVDAFCGANKDTRMNVRFIMEVAWQAHFVRNMFIKPTEEELKTFEPNFTVYTASKAKVENSVVVPAVFVVADEQTLRVCRKGGLACSAKSEEDGGVLALHVGICRAVHSCNTLQWKVVVHHREHTLLHFATVPGVEDNLLTAGDVEYNCGFAVEAEFLVVLNFCLRSGINGEVRFESLEFFFCRLDEHIAYEVSLPSNFHDEAHVHAGILVGTAESINYEQFLVAKLLLCKVFHYIPSFLRANVVVVLVFIGSPPYGIL